MNSEDKSAWRQPFEQHHEAIDMLIDAHMKIREVFSQALGDISWSERWQYEEFRTMHVNIGRRTGKTEYIMRNATKDDAVVMTQGMFEVDLYTRTEAKVVPDGALDWLRGRKYRRVWVDEPKLCLSNGRRSEFWKIIVPCRPELIVMLGT